MEGTLRVLAYEGPAGSGKTTAIRQLIPTLGAEALVQRPIPEPPRDYGLFPGGAGHMTLLKDFNSIADFITKPLPVRVVDRFVLSSIVYDHLRISSIPSHKDIDRIFRYWMSVLTDLPMALEHRGIPIWKRGTIEWAVFLPLGGDALTDRRSRSGRSYPFSVYAEIAVYRSIFDYLDRHFGGAMINGWTLEFTALETDEESHGVIRRYLS